MHYLLVLGLFAFGGSADGYRDYDQHLRSVMGYYAVLGVEQAKVWEFEHPGDRRLKFPKSGWLIDIPLDDWHIAKTLAYAGFAGGTYYSARKNIPWAAVIGWVVIRPIFQNSTQWSMANGKLTFKVW